MPTIEHQDYKGYAIVAMATPAASGKYHSIFSVSTPEEPDAASQAALVYQEKITDTPAFATEAEAVAAARTRAEAWIDTNAS